MVGNQLRKVMIGVGLFILATPIVGAIAFGIFLCTR
ncbi:hypothetical protein KS4_24410 [Poriferisphaera corsica]|uniref:Uncharacterized protein n=1 Tax=Poriferisphaera corsica TaxID=2528020 RepID=A0A517YVY0_9BACT|nr:hypothetical protein KS4_24410 [Poriferisphaera corsica]